MRQNTSSDPHQKIIRRNYQFPHLQRLQSLLSSQRNCNTRSLGNHQKIEDWSRRYLGL